MTAAASSEFAGRTCTAPAARSDRMRDIVVKHVPADRPLRILDLGCGTGSLVHRLTAALPEATLVGIDVSTANIAAAVRQSGTATTRARFIAADYLQYHDRPFDAIVSDGVLHLIPDSTDVLVEKLVRDLTAGGIFICGMPYDCAYNRAFSVLRRMLRATRSGVSDRAILATARLIHGRDMDEASLRERVAYMYVPPARVLGPALIRRFEQAGLVRAATHHMSSTSLSQLRHNVTVWTKGQPQR